MAEFIEKFEYSFESVFILWGIPVIASIIAGAYVLSLFIYRYAKIEKLPSSEIES